MGLMIILSLIENLHLMKNLSLEMHEYGLIIISSLELYIYK